MGSITYKHVHRHLLAIDCIIFGFDGEDLKGLFVKRKLEPQKGNWSLMGGFVSGIESVDAAAERVLYELTGLGNIYMEQLHCYGALDRDIEARVVSIAYFALINIADYSKELLEEHHATWVSLKKLPDLIFDHRQMVEDAKEKLREKVATHPVGFALLPPKFTLKQLQALYEAIYEMPLDKRNFSRKIFSMNILQKLEEKEKASSRKGSFYFIFDEAQYKLLEKEGLKFI
ncbi:NUDIX hydrolase [Parasediminibacterium sp. JCM 36343]|uniref:NUDIX hydrolase n=1 Tax=Parasediminibacterium sp. JCM 36343 TaxID=3374279 RepID=UPI00397AEC99